MIKAILPETKSRNWFGLIILVLLLNLGFFLLSRYLVGASISFQNLVAFAILSGTISLTLTTGYFGLRVWALTIIAFNILAHIYLLSSSYSKVSDGWTDLANLLGSLMYIIIGFVLGAILQLIDRIRRKNIDKVL